MGEEGSYRFIYQPTRGKLEVMNRRMSRNYAYDSQAVWTETGLIHSSTLLEEPGYVPVVYLWVRAHTSRHQLPQEDAVGPLKDSVGV